MKKPSIKIRFDSRSQRWVATLENATSVVFIRSESMNRQTAINKVLCVVSKIPLDRFPLIAKKLA